MASIAGIGIILAIVFTLLFFPGFIILQIFLSKRDNRGVGLILPIISFVMAILIALVVSAGMAWNVGTSSDDMAIQEYVEEYDGETVIIDEDDIVVENTEDYSAEASGVYMSVFAIWLMIFMISNIPTIIYLIIYFVCRAKRRKKLNNSPQKQLEKMNIQDLG